MFLIDLYTDVKISFNFAARPAIYNYVIIMFVFSAITLFGCGLAGIGTSFGNW